jgi:hypothetical protein
MEIYSTNYYETFKGLIALLGCWVLFFLVRMDLYLLMFGRVGLLQGALALTGYVC